MKIRNRYLMLLVFAWGPCLLAAVACYAAILRPQQERRRGLETKLADSKVQYNRALQAAKEKTQGHLAGEVKTLDHRIGDFVLGAENASNLAFQIGALANEAKLESFSMRPVNQSGTSLASNLERLGQKQVDLAFNAAFPHFGTFLNALERHRPILFVQTFAINRPTEPGTDPRASMELAILEEKPSQQPGG